MGIDAEFTPYRAKLSSSVVASRPTIAAAVTWKATRAASGAPPATLKSSRGSTPDDPEENVKTGLRLTASYGSTEKTVRRTESAAMTEPASSPLSRR